MHLKRELLYRTDMYNNEYTAICRLNRANKICFGDASSLTEALCVCVDFLKTTYKKFAENLVVMNICILSLSLSLSLPRAVIYKIPFNYQWVTNNIFPGFFYSGKSWDWFYPSSSFCRQKKNRNTLWQYAKNGYIMIVYRQLLTFKTIQLWDFLRMQPPNGRRL